MADVIAKTAYDVLDAYGVRLESALSANLRTLKNNASGNLQSSIRFNIVILPQGSTFELFMPDYWKYVDKGREPTKNATGGGHMSDDELMKLDWSPVTLRGRLLKWIANKGIVPKDNTATLKVYGRNRAAGKVSGLTDLLATRRMAFAMSRKIHRLGYVGKGFFTNAMKPGEAGDIKLLEKELARVIGKAVVVNIVEEVNGIGGSI